LSLRDTTRALIIGCAGTTLDAAERQALAEFDPLGFILFARNVSDPAGTRALIADLRRAVGRDDAPILIDQEGGRVRRLRPPHWAVSPPAALLGKLDAVDGAAAIEAARLNGRLIGTELRELGITVDCAPVADVPIAGAHDVIGDRAFARDPLVVSRLARATAEGLRDVGIQPVVKHMPGHGRALADSHHDLPRVTASRRELEAHDFVPFQALADLGWGMTAHVCFDALDPDRPATQSPIVVNLIRETLGFDGLLLSDDLAMQALKGSPGERVAASLSAGCDVGLFCSGVLNESIDAARVAPPLTAAARHRLDAASRRWGRDFVAPAHQAEWRARIDALLGRVPMT
jgi:beta-N-acetylhexosaminidase